MSRQTLKQLASSALAAVFAFNPILPVLPVILVQAAESNIHSIEVCFITLDSNGNVRQGLPTDSIASIDLYSEGVDLQENQINSYGINPTHITYSSSQQLNRDLLNNDGINDGYCSTQQFQDPTNTQYSYSRSSILSPRIFHETLYNDQFNIQVQTTNDAFSYSGEFFDEIVGNESQRNINADGHIVMQTGSRVYRHLIVLNQLQNPDPVTTPPEINTNLNAGAEYTNTSTVDVGLTAISEGSGLNQIRFASNEIDMETQNWSAYSDFSGTYVLPNTWESGLKNLCTQVMDSSNQVSNISCDNILLDNTAPTGSIEINGGEAQTNSNSLNLTLSATDPDLLDGNSGSGIHQMRFSEDNTTWSTWETFQTTKQFTTTSTNSLATIYVQYNDTTGNISETANDSIEINLTPSDGHISINDDDMFTDTSSVTLELSSPSVTPEYMRFTQTIDSEQANTPPTVFDPSDDLGGWTYWYEYTDTLQWDLESPPAGTSNTGFGKKNIYVQYMTQGSESELFSDSIVYAPYYGVEYTSVDHSELLVPQAPVEGENYQPIIPEYTLDNIPTSIYSQDTLAIKLNTKNSGSLTWTPCTVNITYFWEKIEVIPELESFVQDSVRGNNTQATSNIGWNQHTGTLSLGINTPDYPGTYRLRIDTSHEGHAYFSDYNNDSPAFEIEVDQNPELNIPKLPAVEQAPNSGYYPGNPQAGQIHTICGYVRYAETNVYNAPYKIEETDGSGAVWYITQYDIGGYLNQHICAPIQFTTTGSLNFTLVGWDSEPVAYPTAPIYVRPGDRVELEIRYRNLGYHHWAPGPARLGTQQPQDRNSQFFDPTSWLYSSRIAMDNTNTVWFGDVARYRFFLNTPTNIPGGTYTECFRPLVEAVSWAGGSNRDVCITIIVETNPSNPIPNTLPPLPPLPTGDTGYVMRLSGLDVLSGPHPGFPVVATVPYGEAITVTGETRFGTHSHWLEVQTAGGITGWVPASAIDHINDPEDKVFSLGSTYIPSHICSSFLTARIGPGDQFAVKEILPNGTNTYILSTFNGWNLINMPNGTTGWVKSGTLCGGHTGGHIYSGTTGASQVAGQSFYGGQVYQRPLNTGSYSISSNYTTGHRATDYAAACGTPVFAVADGTVASAVGYFTQNTYRAAPVAPTSTPTGNILTDTLTDIVNQIRYEAELAAYNALKFVWMSQVNYIAINHDNGTQSVYLHLKSVDVTAGQVVRKGQKIGTVGNTGWSTGCHLHLEIRADQNNPASRINPESIFNSGISTDILAASSAMSSREVNSAYRTVRNNNGLLHDYCGAWIKDYEYLVEPGQNWYTYTNLIFNPSTATALRLRGNIRIAYWDKYSGTCGELGLPTTDDLWAARSPQGTTGAYQKFDNGTVHSSARGTFATIGELNKLHTELGGTASSYGFPIDEQFKEGEKECQLFEGGKLCYSPTPPTNAEQVKDILDSLLKKEKVIWDIYSYATLPDWLADRAYKELRIKIARLSTRESGVTSLLDVGDIQFLQNQLTNFQQTFNSELISNTKLRWLLTSIYVRNLRTLRHQGLVSDLEAFASGAEFISGYWDNSSSGVDNFEKDLAVVFSNRDGKNCVLSGVGCFGDNTDAQIAYSVLDFGDTGFANYFRDSKYFTEHNNSFENWPTQKPPNAVFHTMGGGINFAYSGDWHCSALGFIGCKTTVEWLTWHETEQHSAEYYDYKKPHPEGHCGSSWEDLFSSYVGINLGEGLRNRQISVENFGKNIRSSLGMASSHNYCTDFVNTVPAGNYWQITCEDIPYDRLNGYWNSDIDADQSQDHCPNAGYY